VTGLTSNPSIYDLAVTHTGAYDEAMRTWALAARLQREGTNLLASIASKSAALAPARA